MNTKLRQIKQQLGGIHIMNIEHESNLFNKYEESIDNALANDDFDRVGDNLDDLYDAMSRNSESRRKFYRLVNVTIARIRTRMRECDLHYDWTNLYHAADGLTNYISFTECLTDDEYEYLKQVRSRAYQRQGNYDTGIATLFLAENEIPDVADHVDTIPAPHDTDATIATIPDDDTDDDYVPAFARK